MAGVSLPQNTEETNEKKEKKNENDNQLKHIKNDSNDNDNDNDSENDKNVTENNKNNNNNNNKSETVENSDVKRKTITAEVHPDEDKDDEYMAEEMPDNMLNDILNETQTEHKKYKLHKITKYKDGETEEQRRKRIQKGLQTHTNKIEKKRTETLESVIANNETVIALLATEKSWIKTKIPQGLLCYIYCFCFCF